MLFQVINEKGISVMRTEAPSCIPIDSHLTSMSKVGYKFKIDGKFTPIKKIKEIRDEALNEKNKL